jgi:excisionase family DNA binding protein
MNDVQNTKIQERKDTKTDVFSALTVNAKQAAKLLNISQRQLWRLNSTGRLPKPIRLGHCVRWRKAELEAFIEAGAPTREKWEMLTTKNTK